MEDKIGKLEAILFIHGEPLPIKKVAAVLEITEKEAEDLVIELGKKLEERSAGLMLVVNDHRVQMATRPQFSGILAEFVKKELTEDLTPASLETLAIVAYFGPISRNRIEYQRGVNSIFTLRNLLIRGLVERYPNPEHPQSYLYIPSFELLKHLGVASQKDLPEFEKFKELLRSFEAGEIKKEGDEQ